MRHSCLCDQRQLVTALTDWCQQPPKLVQACVRFRGVFVANLRSFPPTPQKNNFGFVYICVSEYTHASVTCVPPSETHPRERERHTQARVPFHLILGSHWYPENIITRTRNNPESCQSLIRERILVGGLTGRHNLLTGWCDCRQAAVSHPPSLLAPDANSPATIPGMSGEAFPFLPRVEGGWLLPLVFGSVWPTSPLVKTRLIVCVLVLPLLRQSLRTGFKVSSFLLG